MTKLEWLIKQADQDIKEGTEHVLDAWFTMGQVTMTPSSIFYPQGSLFRVDATGSEGQSPAPLHNCILYCQQEYAVGVNNLQKIDWSVVEPDDVSGMLCAVEGVALPYFVIIPEIKWNGSYHPDPNYLPFQDGALVADESVKIDDTQLMICLTDLGMPWLTWNEVEYSRAQIVNLCVRPALDWYYTYFPIIKEDGTFAQQYASGAPFKIEMPEGAYSAVVYYVAGVGGAGAGGGQMSPFSFFNESLIWGGSSYYGLGSTRYGRGLSYLNKQTPGFTGVQSRYSAMFDNLAIGQQLKNYMRQEHYHIIKENGKRYITGFSTIGGLLNVKWLCTSYDWEDVLYEHLEPIARPMVKIKALEAVKAIRDLVKSDTPGQLDTQPFKEKADKLEEKIKPLINALSTDYAMAFMRGGQGQ